MHMPKRHVHNLNEFVYRVYFGLAIDTHWAHCLQGDDIHVGLGRDHRLDVLDGPVHDEVCAECARDEVAADIGGRPGSLDDTLETALVVVKELFDVNVLALQVSSICDGFFFVPFQRLSQVQATVMLW